MRAGSGVRSLLPVPDDRTPPPEPDSPDIREPAQEPSPAQELEQGLSLLLRAARRAVGQLDTSRIDDYSRRAVERIDQGGEQVERYTRKAVEQLEQLDAKKLRELGVSAVKNLHPKRIETLADEAGKGIEDAFDRVRTKVSEAVRPPPASERRRPKVRIEDDAPADDEPPQS